MVVDDSTMAPAWVTVSELMAWHEEHGSTWPVSGDDTTCASKVAIPNHVAYCTSPDFGKYGHD